MKKDIIAYITGTMLVLCILITYCISRHTFRDGELLNNLYKKIETETSKNDISDISNKNQTEKIKFCPYCGTEIKSTYNYCTECGEKQN